MRDVRHGAGELRQMETVRICLRGSQFRTVCVYCLWPLVGKERVVFHRVVDSGTCPGDYIFVERVVKDGFDEFGYKYHEVFLCSACGERRCSEAYA